MLDLPHASNAASDGGLLLADRQQDALRDYGTPDRVKSAFDRRSPTHAPDFLVQALGNTIGLFGSSLYGWRKEDAALLDAFAAPGGTFVNTVHIMGHPTGHVRAITAAPAAAFEVVSALSSLDTGVVPLAGNVPIRPTTMVGPFYATLAWLRHALSEPGAAAFTRQLQALFEDEEELRDEGIEPSLQSFVGLMRFMGSASGSKHPNLSLTRTGEFQASWSSGADRRITLTFEGGVSVRWSAVDRVAPERDSGRFSLTDAAPVLERYGVWMQP